MYWYMKVERGPPPWQGNINSHDKNSGQIKSVIFFSRLLPRSKENGKGTIGL